MKNKTYPTAMLLLLFYMLNGQKALIEHHTSMGTPNIIFILTDDQRYDALGYAGNKDIVTPYMDALAKEGSHFSQAVVTTPICAASRASILTGLYERTHTFNFQTGDLPDTFIRQSYPYLLKESGYQTAFFGKLGVNTQMEAYMFDTYDIYDRNNAYPDYRGYYYKTIDKDTVHLTRYTGHQAMNYLENVDKNKPFCLSLSFSAPHAHDKAPEQYFWQSTSNDLYAKNINDPILASDQDFAKLPIDVQKGFNRTRWHWRFDDAQKYQHSVKGYYRMITEIDNELGKIRKTLKENGLDKNTIIILMGDNGYFLGERQLAGKWLMYDNSIRVPLIIFDPRSKNQYDHHHQVLNVDIPATILDFAGVKIPQTYHGKSLKKVLSKKKSSSIRDTILVEHLWEFDHIPPSEGIRTEQLKYFKYINDMRQEELYDLASDPNEAHNLIHDPSHQTTIDQMRASLNSNIAKYKGVYSHPPSDLSIEYIRQPQSITIHDSQPEFAWTLGPYVRKQIAYQILVSSSLDLINKNVGDIWNSHRINSNTSINVTYQGPSLRDNKQYYWKVRVWSEENRITDYSYPQAFSITSKPNTISTPNYFTKEYINPVSTVNTDGGTFFDFGKAAFATMNFDYTSSAKDTLVVHLGEKLKNPLKIDDDPGGHIRYQKIKVVVSEGQHHYQVPVHIDQRNTKPEAVALPDSIPVLMPYRYAFIENANHKDISNVNQEAYFNYWEEDNSAFTSSDTILNQVYDLCKYSIKATSFAGLYVDGDRERIPYEADAYINQLSHYGVDREYAIAKQTLEYFMEYPTWPTEWQQHVPMMFHADYMYTGDTELIIKYYEALKYKTLQDLARTDGLISSNNATPLTMKNLGFKDPNATLKDITDWPPSGWQGNPDVMGERDGFEFMPYNTVINSFYYRNLLIMADFADILDKKKEAVAFRLEAERVKSRINEILLDRDRGIYIDGEGSNHASLHANMMPLAFGIVPEQYRQSVLDHVESRGMACSVYGSQYLMDGLYQYGLQDYALSLLNATHDRSWYNMIKVGSTITLEAWDMKYKPNADWNHAWGAAPANIIPRKLWGIEPLAPGFAIATIMPQLGSLKHSSITVPTIRGNIVASYKKVGNTSTYNIFIPSNMGAIFSLRDSHEYIISVDGNINSGVFDDIRLEPGNHTIKVTKNNF